MIDKILEDREKRYNIILELIEKHGLPVLCGKINYPGNNKNAKEAKEAFNILLKSIEEVFQSYTIDKVITSGYDGSGVILVLNIESKAAKGKAVAIEENHSIGRIFDIDIYDTDGAPLSREDKGMQPRKCMVCGQNARECMKLKRHSLEETLKIVNGIINNYGG